jgi:hypothetical protein
MTGNETSKIAAFDGKNIRKALHDVSGLVNM